MATSEELRDQSRQATAEARTLAVRMGELPSLIEAKRAEIRAARIQAARDGEDPTTATVALESDLEGLRAELADLPDIHYAKRELAADLQIGAEEALIDETGPQIQQAEQELEPLEIAEAQAKEAAVAKRRQVSALENTVRGALRRRERLETLQETIAREGPRPLAAFGAEN
jgi:hypothetical protein